MALIMKNEHLQNSNDINISKIIHSRRKNVSLVINSNAQLIVKAPYHISVNEIKHIVRKKEDWIISKQNLVITRLKNQRKIKFSYGEKLLYLGKEYPLKFTDSTNISVSFDGMNFILSLDYIEQSRKEF